MPPTSETIFENTQFDAEALIPYLESHYALARPVACAFIRRGFNDHYRVSTPDGDFVFRIYFNGKYYIESDDDFRFELDLLTHLRRDGVSVSVPLPRRDGASLGAIESPAGPRSCALFSFADGTHDEAMIPDRARTLGETVARFHASADRFRSSHRRYHLDLTYLVDEPMRRITDALRERNRGGIDGLEAFQPGIDALKRDVRRLPVSGDAYGIIHGDLHTGNFVFTDDGRPTLFDFDHGGFGWRAYDLSVCQAGIPEASRPAFFDGYRTVRPISDLEMELLPTFEKIRPIWDVGDVMAMFPAWGRATVDDETVDGAVRRIEKLFGQGA